LLIEVITLVAAGVAIVVSAQSVKEYEATAKLLLGTTQSVDALLTGQASSGSGDPERDVNTHVDLVTEDTVAQAVKKELKLRESVGSLTHKASASIAGNSNIIDVKVRDRDPRRAAAIASGFADQYTLFEQRSVQGGIDHATTLVRRKYATLSPNERSSPEGRQLKARLRELEIASGLQTGGVSVVRRASVPTSAVTPRPVRTGIIAGVLGFLFAVAAAVGLHFADNRLRDQDEVEALFDVPVLAYVPPPRRRRTARRPGDDAGQHAAYMTLATNLRFFDASRTNDAILVTSPGQQEGKTSVTLGLARAFALLGQRVVAIEADFRRPVFARLLELPSSFGADREPVELDAATLRPVYGADPESAPTFAVVPGLTVKNPQRLLADRATADLITSAKERADIVLIDAPPVGIVNDAVVLSRHVDGALLVARRNRTRRDEAARSMNLLDNVGTRVLGVVMTDIRSSGQRGYAAPTASAHRPGKDEPVRLMRR
jgi:capsular exopolysaccharide synthesis family protein